jgi:hypothetical protein
MVESIDDTALFQQKGMMRTKINLLGIITSVFRLKQSCFSKQHFTYGFPHFNAASF